MARRVEVRSNMIDRLLQYVAPVHAARRFQARAMLSLAGGYVGASKKRRSINQWKTTGGSADADLLPDLATLRERSRDLNRNSPIACGAINTTVTSVVGPGLKMKSVIDRETLKLNDKTADAWQARAELLWSLYADTTECDVTRTQVHGEMQDLVFRSALENGDVFSLLPMIPRNGSPFETRILLIEADRVTNPRGQTDSDTLAGGIEMDEHGAPKNYHFLKNHPGGLSRRAREWDVVPAFGEKSGRRNVLHHFTRRRVGQTRGVPYLAPVIESLKQLEDYTEAELMAAVISGMFTVFIKTEDGDGGLGPMMPTAETGGASSDDDYKLGNGAIVGLAQGEDISTANPGRPNAAFDPFVKAILEQVGVALELPLEVLIKHFTASYSASRAAMLEAWRFFKSRRIWLVRSFCQPTYEAFITEMVARGMLSAPGFFSDPVVRHAYLYAEWIGRPMGHVQPLQEANAAVARVEAGITSLTKEIAEYDGGDFGDVHRQRKMEVKRRREDGVQSATTPKPGAPALPAPSEPDMPTDHPDDAPDKPEEN